ncbi:ESX secretion-associated protein EspG [Amycolatopsis sp. NBC_00345]|uniref:ESX secretion-associated protein EspG n=1 Tax=Amycolatopsis sp. NBC_00345 TaxID=2975955 RepID=UPI002E25C204
MTVLAEPVVLPAAVFSTAWTMLDLGDPHPIFGVGRFWSDESARWEQHVAAMAFLARTGLAAEEALAPRWRATLQVLGHAEQECFGWSELQNGNRGAAIAVRQGQDAVLAKVYDGLVELHPIPATRLATALHDTLPPLPAAAIRPVAVEPRSETADPFEDGTDREYLSAVLRNRQLGVHQLYSAVRTGRDRRVGGPITVVDLEIGRVLTYRRENDRTELIPGGPPAVVKVLNDICDAL